MNKLDKIKLELAGGWYNPSSQYGKSLAWEFRVNNKGWYMGREYIGHNIREALETIGQLEGNSPNTCLRCNTQLAQEDGEWMCPNGDCEL